MILNMHSDTYGNLIPRRWAATGRSIYLGAVLGRLPSITALDSPVVATAWLTVS